MQWSSIRKWLLAKERRFLQWSRQEGLTLLRYSLAIVFIWFGILKPLGMSPAAELVKNTVYWLPPEFFVPLLGWWEVAIGVCLVVPRLVRIGLGLLFFQMIGTFLPLVVLPDIVFIRFPFVLSTEGQYVIKNIVFLAAGIVIAGHVRKIEAD